MHTLPPKNIYMNELFVAEIRAIKNACKALMAGVIARHVPTCKCIASTTCLVYSELVERVMFATRTLTRARVHTE